MLAEVAVHATARRVEDEPDRRAPGRLDDAVREEGSLVEVDGGVGHRLGDVGVRRQVHDRRRARASRR